MTTKQKEALTKAIDELNAISSSDPESAHAHADDIILTFLEEGGFPGIRIAYDDLRGRCSYWADA